MAEVPEAKLALVRALMERAPDRALRSLMAALSGVEEGPMMAVRELVSAEAGARRIGRAVLAPLAPLCEPRNHRPGYPTFPSATLAALWRAVRRSDPDLAATVLATLQDSRPGDVPPKVIDRVALAAADLLKADPASVLGPLAATVAVDVLISCLELSPIAREPTHLVRDWLGRPGDEELAALKVVYNDSVLVRPDAAPLMTAMLAAHLAEPHLALRLISMVMDRPSDNYFAASELAPFGERLLEVVDRHIEQVRTFNPRDLAAARAAAAGVLSACAILNEFETAFEVGRRSAWGKRLAAQRNALATAGEARMDQVEAAVEAALPYQSSRIVQRVVQNLPRVDQPPDADDVASARGLLTFLDVSRTSAALGGFGAARNRTVEAVGERLRLYVDELLGSAAAAEDLEETYARAYAELAAEFVGLATDDDGARLVRRRAAVIFAAGASARASQAVA